MVHHAFHRSDKLRTDAEGWGRPRKRDVVFREEVDAASSALEHADYPLAVLSQASRGLDHRATAVGAGGGFWHGGG